MSAALREKLEILRLIDGKVDFSKATVQFDILLSLAVSDSGLTAHELSQRLRLKYKTISDALRKMVFKGLVEKMGERYILTNEGKLLYDSLLSVLGLTKQDYLKMKRHERDVWSLTHDLVTVNHLYDAILALGLSERYMLDLKTLAKVMGLSVNRAKVYLDLFTQYPFKLLHVVRVSGFTQRVKWVIGRAIPLIKGKDKIHTTLYYMLTERGLKVFNRLPYRVKINRNKFTYKLLLRVFDTLHPRIIIKRISLIMSLSLIVVLICAIALIILSSIHQPILIAIDVVILVIVLLLTVFLFTLYKMT